MALRAGPYKVRPLAGDPKVELAPRESKSVGGDASYGTYCTNKLPRAASIFYTHPTQALIIPSCLPRLKSRRATILRG